MKCRRRPTREPPKKVEGWLIEAAAAAAAAVDRFQRAFYSGAPGPGVGRTTNLGGNCWEADFGWLLERRGGYKRVVNGVSFVVAVVHPWWWWW